MTTSYRLMRVQRQGSIKKWICLDTEIDTFVDLESAKRRAKSLQDEMSVAIIMPDGEFYDWSQDTDWMERAPSS